MRFSPAWVAAALAALAACSARAAGTNDDAQARLQALQEGLRGTVSVRTDFVQQRRLALLQQDIEITGNIVTDESGRLAWRVTAPLRYMLVLDGTNLRQWDEATGREQQMSLKGNPVFEVVARQMRGWFRGDFAPLLKDFDVRAPSDRPRSLVFVPHADSFAGKAVKQVTMTCREDRRYLQELLIEEATGDQTRMVFTNTVLNATVTADDWKVGPGGPR